MKYRDLFTLKKVLTSIIEEDYDASVEFSLAIIKNNKLIEKEISDIQEVSKPNEKFLEYDRKRLELAKEYSKGDDGKVNSKDLGNGNVEYLIQSDKQEEFKKEFNSLKEEYQEYIDKHDIQQKDLNAYLNKEIDFEFKLIDPNKLPEKFKTSHLDKLFPIINFELEN